MLCLCPRLATTQDTAPAMMIETARSADSFVDSIGVNTHLGYTDTIYAHYDSLIKPRLQELGVRHIRDGTRDDVVARYKDLARIGIKLDLIVNTKNAVSDAKKVLSCLDSLEGPNEPDHGETWVADTRREQEALYAAVKGDKETARLPVLGSGMANTRDSALKLGALAGALDIGNFHPYAGGKPPTSGGWGITMLEAIRRERTVCGHKPLWATECGYHNRLEEQGHPGVTETAMARYYPRMFLLNFNDGIGRSYAYEFADEKPDPGMTDKEQHFGLLHNDGSPKPAFTVLQHLITLLKDPGPAFKPATLDYALSGATTNLAHTLLQKRDGTFYLLLWQEVPSYDLKTHADLTVPSQTVTLTLGTSIRRVFLFRPSSGLVPVVLYNNPHQIPLTVSDDLLVLQMFPR